MKGRGTKLLSPGKEDGDSFKTPAKTAGKTRSSRSVTLPREVGPCLLACNLLMINTVLFSCARRLQLASLKP